VPLQAQRLVALLPQAAQQLAVRRRVVWLPLSAARP
jgi:hypothetical protein